MNPEILHRQEWASLKGAARSTESPLSRGDEVRPGSESVGASTKGRPGTWESSSFPPWLREGHTRSPSPGRAVGLATVRSEHTSRWWYRGASNEATRDERRAVGAARSTEEAGEPTHGTPWREGGAGRENRRSER
jgi:hypothetical protein